MLTENETALVTAIRQIVREEIAKAIGGAQIPRLGKTEVDVVPAAAVVTYMDGGTTTCGAVKGSLVCLKPKHRGKHKFQSKPHVSPLRAWESIDSFMVQPTPGGKRFEIKVGNPCKVTKTGKRTTANPDGATTDGWIVHNIERHVETGKINVAVQKGRGTAIRTFPSDRIEYQRPKKAVA